METMYKQEETKETRQDVNKEHKGKEAGDKQVPSFDMPESSAQGEARAMSRTNGPHCYRCLTRGHLKEECTVTLFCDICECVTHVKGRCPLLKNAKLTYALTCGYAVDGLGFYYILNSVVVQSRAVVKIALIRVVEGSMNALQVKLEM
jgi:hypothetical protein